MVPPADETLAPSKLTGVARENIESITQISQEFARNRSHADRLGQAVTRGAATAGFVVGHLFGVSVWVAVNTGFFSAIEPFDPYPFSLLALLVSLEAVFLATFVLMAQKRQTQQAEHWAHLNLQIGLLAEQEATKMLQLPRSISERLGVQTSHDTELSEMAEKTAVNHLAQELAENLERTRETESR